MTNIMMTVRRDSMGFENIDEFWDAADGDVDLHPSSKAPVRTSSATSTGRSSGASTMGTESFEGYDTSDSISEVDEEEEEEEEPVDDRGRGKANSHRESNESTRGSGVGSTKQSSSKSKQPQQQRASLASSAITGFSPSGLDDDESSLPWADSPPLPVPAHDKSKAAAGNSSNTGRKSTASANASRASIDSLVHVSVVPAMNSLFLTVLIIVLSFHDPFFSISLA